MIRSKDKISLRQGIFLVIINTYVSVIRIYPSAASEGAKEAGWLIPIPSFLIMLPYFWVLGQIFNKYKESSYMDIINDIWGKYIGKIICIGYLMGATLQSSAFIRFSGERIVSTMFPNINISIFLLIMLVLVGYALYSGIAAAARMGEIILPLIIFVFILSFIFTIPYIKISNLTPVFHRDVIPVLKTGISTTIPFISYYTIIFFFADRLNDKEKIFKYGIYFLLFMTVTGVMLIIMSVGSLSHTFTKRLTFPYLTTIRNISAFEIFQRLESLVFAIWILCDFIAIYVASYIGLILMKSIFKLKKETALIIPLLSFRYIFSLYLASNRSELYEFGGAILVVSEVTSLIAIPLFTYIIGKIRGKL